MLAGFSSFYLISVNVAPEINTTTIEDKIKADENKPMLLEADVQNAMSVCWLLNGNELENDRNIQMKQKGTRYSLNIGKMNPELAGEYTLEAVSNIGQVTKKVFTVDVKGEYCFSWEYDLIFLLDLVFKNLLNNVLRKTLKYSSENIYAEVIIINIFLGLFSNLLSLKSNYSFVGILYTMIIFRKLPEKLLKTFENSRKD